MYKNKKYTVVIPARAGSKGIKNKNIIKINKHPLISYSIIAAKKSKFVDEIYVSTDGKKISEIAKKYGAKVIKRPKNISDNITMPDSAVTFTVEYIINKLGQKVDNVIFLQPTSPLRCHTDIDKAIIKFHNDKCDSIFSGVSLHPCIWNSKIKKKLKPVNYNPFKRKRRQIDYNNIVENGSIYISKKNTYLKKNNRHGNKISCYLMNYICLLQIDDHAELKLTQSILKSKDFDYLQLIKP